MSVVPIGYANPTTAMYEENSGVFVTELGNITFPDVLVNGVPKVYTWRPAPAFGPAPGMATPITTVIADATLLLSFSTPPGSADLIVLTLTISGNSPMTNNSAFTLKEEVQLALPTVGAALGAYLLHVSGLVRVLNSDPLLVTIESNSLGVPTSTVSVVGGSFKGRVLN